MKWKPIFLLSIIMILPIVHAVAEETTLAVLNFENHSLFDREAFESLSTGLAEMMITEIKQVQSIQVVERRRLQEMLDELKLSQSGVISEASSLQVGRMLGARHLVFGGFIVAMDEKIRIDIRIVEVETGLTVKADEVTGQTKEILTLIKKLSKKLLQDLNVKLSGDEQKQLAQSEKMELKAVLLYSEGLELEEEEKLAEARDKYLLALKIEPNFRKAKERLSKLGRE